VLNPNWLQGEIMSVIDIQTTRAQKNKPTEVGRQRYEKDVDGKASQLPFYVGLSISALLLYLKSSIVPGAEAHNLEEAPHLPHVNANSPVEDDLVLTEGNSIDICTIDVPDAQASSHKNIHRSTIHPQDNSLFKLQTATFNLDSLDLNVNYKNEYPKVTQVAGIGFGVLSANDNGLGKPDPEVKPPPPPPKPTDEVTPEKPRNRAPKISGPVRLSDQFQCSVVMIAIADLLSHASDADAGDVLHVGAVKVNGVLLEQMNGQYFYHGEELGPVTINYIVTDGQLSVAATAIVNFIERDAINGTADDDNLLGTNCEDTINGLAGDDHIDGRDGDDNIHGGAGNDILVGGAGDDVIYGEDGDDHIFGGSGNDILFGGAGNDIIFGGDGNDVIDGGTGDDVIHDDNGTDHVNGGEGNDTVVAELDAAKDMFDGGSGTGDKLSYSNATSNLEFDVAKGTVKTAPGVVDQFAHFEILEAGSGNDVFHAAVQTSSTAPEETEHQETEHQETEHQETEHQETEHQETETESETHTSVASEEHGDEHVEVEQSHNIADQGFTYIGGEGSDTLDYSLAKDDISVDVIHGTAKGAELGTDHFEGIEVFLGGQGDDVFTAGQMSVSLNGGAGNDMFEYVIPTCSSAVQTTTQHISGFEVGDWVRIAQYDIFEGNSTSDDNDFQTIIDGIQNQNTSNGDNSIDAVTPIRIRHEISDSGSTTIVESDLDKDGKHEFSIVIDGEHHLQIAEHQHL
jgi:Ca2+-binding RTX toxin-like protein